LYDYIGKIVRSIEHASAHIDVGKAYLTSIGVLQRKDRRPLRANGDARDPERTSCTELSQIDSRSLSQNVATLDQLSPR
jgi:hypothetical protein